MDPERVPKYIWHLVGAHLGPEDVGRLSGASRALWAHFGADEGFWRRRGQTDFGEDASFALFLDGPHPRRQNVDHLRLRGAMQAGKLFIFRLLLRCETDEFRERLKEDWNGHLRVPRNPSDNRDYMEYYGSREDIFFKCRVGIRRFPFELIFTDTPESAYSKS